MRTEDGLQREYYAAHASSYDASHLHAGDEHYFALALLVGALDFLDAASVLEIGSGTGRVLSYLRERCPHVARRGLEPVDELREIAYGKGVSRTELTGGDARKLAFADASHDVVCAFGVLHHVAEHGQVVREMLRVARRAVFISDSNNFGQGGKVGRMIKQALDAVRLWPLANLVKTRGKGYTITDGDGLAYSYSVFKDYPLIRLHCRRVHVINTTSAGGVNPYRSASHVAVLGIK
jgi:ubiquinone/menaquinone biosynthesis C-methylase UbiE